ncbi:MAG: hypothetical protein IJV39_02310 [Ruminococcus sp.]|nr:hypothetical protein [Ruminococcus sp.]
MRNKKTKIKKPFFKRPAGIVLITFLVVLVGGGITVYAMRDTILKWVLGPVNYYFYKEYSNVENLTTADFGIDGSLTLGDELASVSGMLGTDTDDVKINVQHSVSDKKTKLSFDLLGLFKTEFIKDGNYISLDSGTGEPIIANLKKKTDSAKKKNSTVPTITTSENDNYINDNFDIEKATGMGSVSLAKWYLEFSDECITKPIEAGFEEETDYYNDVECTVDTFTINNDIYSKIISNICYKYNNDKKTKEVFVNLTDYLNKRYSLELNADDIFDDWYKYSVEVKTDNPFEYNYAVYYYDNTVVNRVLTLVDREDSSANVEVALGSNKESDTNYIDIRLGNYISGELEVKNSANVSDVDLKGENAVSMSEFLKQTGIIGKNNKKQEKDTLEGISSVLKFLQ